MRVIAGEFKGHRLEAVPGKNTRPTTDKIKEAMFNRLGQYLDGGNVLDLYAGSGALGLEALSRGADRVYGFERHREAVKTIQKNIHKLRVESRYHLFIGNNQKMLEKLRETEPSLTFDWIFLDPPYRGQKIEATIQFLEERHWLNEQSVIVCELSKEDQLPERIGHLICYKSATYGITRLVYYSQDM